MIVVNDYRDGSGAQPRHTTSAGDHMLRTGPAARNGPGEKATSRRRTLWWRKNDATEPSGQYIRRSDRDWRRQSRCRTVLRARNDDMESCRPNLSTPTTTDACGPRKERASRCILYTPRPTRCGIARKIQNERSIRGSDPMIVVNDYRAHRIDVDAVPTGGRFSAEVRIRRTLSDAKPHVEVVSCLKLSAALAEQAGERWAKRHIDLRHEEGSR